MENELERVVLKSSRISFLGNYILAGLAVVFILLLYISFDLKFSILPKDGSTLISTIVLVGLATVALSLMEQPELERYRKQFIITMNEVIEHKGIINKEKVILPYATVADIKVERNILGRLLNYGTLSVSSFRTGSDMMMKGVRHPEKLYVMIQNRVNLIREGQLQMFGKKKDGEKET